MSHRGQAQGEGRGCCGRRGLCPRAVGNTKPRSKQLCTCPMGVVHPSELPRAIFRSAGDLASGEARVGTTLMKHGRPVCHLLRTLKSFRMQAQDRRRYTAPEGASALAYEEDGEQQPFASTSAVRLDGRQPSQVRPICAFLQARGRSYMAYMAYTDTLSQICKPDWLRELPDRRTSRLAGPSCFALCMSTTAGSLYLVRS